MKRKIVWCLVLFVLLLMIGTFVLAPKLKSREPRPLFYNFYGVHPERGGPARWWPIPRASRDKAGNFCLVDYVCNELAILEYQDTGTPIPGFGTSLDTADPKPDGAAAILEIKGSAFHIPREPNSAVLVAESGVLRRVALRSGEARTYYEKWKERTSDRAFNFVAEFGSMAESPKSE